MNKETRYQLLLIGFVGLMIFSAVSIFIYLSVPLADHSAKYTPAALTERQKLTVITRNDLQGYYTYQEEPQGFEYELAKAFADYVGLELQIVAGSNWHDIHNALLTNRADIIAGKAVSESDEELFAFSDSYLTARQVAVTNKKQAAVTSVEELTERDIAVALGSPHQAELDDLMTQGLTFSATYYFDKTTDDFVKGIAEELYDVTLTYDYIAMTYSRHYPNINIGVIINDDVELAWAVHPEDTELLAKINEFFGEMHADGTLERLYNRYFGISHEQSYNELESFHRRIKRNLPSYQNSIRQSAYQHSLDWRLIAAVIYQESQFNPNAVSYYGASGLMQLMPKTAASLGLPAESIYDPHKNIAAGVKYLKRMYDLFEDTEDETERIRLALASYNAGIGHVLDARQMAEDEGLDKNMWENVGPMLLKLMKKEYYSKAKYGYCNGKETNHYVNNIMIYYDILKYQGTNFNVGFDLEEEFMVQYEELSAVPATKLGRLIDKIVRI